MSTSAISYAQGSTNPQLTEYTTGTYCDAMVAQPQPQQRAALVSPHQNQRPTYQQLHITIACDITVTGKIQTYLIRDAMTQQLGLSDAACV